MINLIRAESYKLVKNKSFWYLVISSILLSLLLHLFVMNGWWQLSGTPFDDAGLSDLNALNMYKTPLFFNLFVSTLGAFYISNEFSKDGGVKNQIISGNQRHHILFSKYFIFTLASIVICVILPFLIGIVSLLFLGQGELLTVSKTHYLCIAFVLFIFQFMSFTAIVTLIAIITKDSGKTILFTLLFTIIMLIVEKLSPGTVIEPLYQQTVFYQYHLVFKFNITTAETVHAIFIGGIWILLLLLFTAFIFNRKEIK